MSLLQVLGGFPPPQVIVLVTLLAGATNSKEVRLPIFPSIRFSSTKEATFPDSVIPSPTVLSPRNDSGFLSTFHDNNPVLVVLHSNIALLPGHIVGSPRNSVPDGVLHSNVEPGKSIHTIINRWIYKMGGGQSWGGGGGPIMRLKPQWVGDVCKFFDI